MFGLNFGATGGNGILNPSDALNAQAPQGSSIVNPSTADTQAGYLDQLRLRGQVENAIFSLPNSRTSGLSQALQGSLMGNEGLGQASLDARRREVIDRNAASRSNTLLNLNNRLGANGGGDSPAAALANAQIRTQSANSLDTQLGEIAAQDDAARISRQGQAQSTAANVLANEANAQIGAANVLGNLSSPVFPGLAEAKGQTSVGIQGVNQGKQIGQFSQQEYGSRSADQLIAENLRRQRANATQQNPFQMLRFGGQGGF